MKPILLLALFSSVISCTTGQEIQRTVVATEDPHELYVGDSSSTELFYLQLKPTGPIRGVLVILPSGGESVESTLQQIELHHSAIEHGMMVIVPSINWGTFDRGPEIALLDGVFARVAKEHAVPKDRFIMGGLSNGAMIALTYAERSIKEPGSTFLVPKGVFALDAPLDEARFYAYCEREIARNINANAVREAQWMKNQCDSLLGGSPSAFPQKYIDHSIYSFGATEGGNAKYLARMPLLMFTDMDTDWLMNERHRDLYDWNGIDFVSMVNQLIIMGNTNARVIISQGKGVRPDGSRNPHSWSILDKKTCLDWMDGLLAH